MDEKFTGNRNLMAFDRIIKWNELMGNKHLPMGRSDLLSARSLESHLLEELHELLDQLDGAPVDPVRVCKEAGDMIFILVELIRRMGADPSAVVDLVCDSNETKICRSEEQIEAAKASFKAQGIDFYTCETSSGVAFKAANAQLVRGHEIAKDKILKVPNFTKAEPKIRDHFRDLLGGLTNG